MPTASHNSHELSADVLRWVADAVGSGATIRSVISLPGATSSVLHGIEVERNKRSLKLVLRRFVDADWLRDEPELARHEAANLRVAAQAGVPTPELIAYDEKGAHCDVPATLMTRLPGSVELRPQNFDLWLHQLAAAIVPFHSIEARRHAWSYFPYSDLARLAPPGWSRARGLWEQAIAIVAGPRPRTRACFIHRDYHPTNVLWQNGAVSGVVDWVNACRGAAGFDVAWCRQNLALLYGVAAADGFLHAYQSLAGASFTYDPYWDLIAIIEVLPGPPGVYAGWSAFGITHLDEDIIGARIDQYLASLIARL